MIILNLHNERMRQAKPISCLMPHYASLSYKLWCNLHEVYLMLAGNKLQVSCVKLIRFCVIVAFIIIFGFELNIFVCFVSS